MSRLESQPIKRLGIFVFFNKHGEAGAYVRYLLNDISPCLDDLYIVANCNLSFSAIQLLKEFSEKIFIRENSGLDAAAFKKALLYYCGLEKLQEYDEVILFNDTFYGPFISFHEIFKTMDSRDVDFWGIMAGYKAVDGLNCMPEGYIPDHIQSWFRAFRRSLVSSDAFKSYWNNYDENITTFWDVVTKHELVFTQHFERLGFKWDIFCNSLPYRSEKMEKNYNYYVFSIELMLREMNMPFMKRKPFSLDRKDILYMNGGEDLKRAVSYLAREHNYPLEIIFQDLLRNYNVYDIYDSLHLNYILPQNDFVPEPTHAAVGIIINCHSLENLEYIRRYIENISKIYSVYVCTPSDTCQSDTTWSSKVKEMGAILVPCQGEGIFTINEIECICEYEYILFLHDAEDWCEDKPETIHTSILFNYCENIIHDANYIDGMIELFEQESCLGMLLAPTPLHHKFFHFYENSWGEVYEKVLTLAKALRLKANIDINKPILSDSGVFFCRRQVIDKLLRFPVHDSAYHTLGGMPVFRRLLQFLAQDAGFYTGIVMTQEYASLELMNQRYYLSSIMHLLYKHLGTTPAFFDSYLNNISCVFSGLSSPPNTDEQLLCSLYEKISERDREIARLYPLTSLKVQLKLRMQKYMPTPLYKIILSLKRVVFGPRQIAFDYTK